MSMQSMISNLPSYKLEYVVTPEVMDNPPSIESENVNELLLFITFERNELEKKFQDYWVSHNGILEFIFYTSFRTKTKNLQKLNSKELDTSNYKGKYIAVHENTIIGWGETPGQAYEMAKKRDAKLMPALTYVPENEDVIYFFAMYPC